MGNKVQSLFNELVNKYNLRAIKIGDETWYAMNDLPLKDGAIRKKLHDISDVTLSTPNFVEQNTRIVTWKDLRNTTIKNFNKINNRGERFGNKTMMVYLIQNSHMTISDKEKYLSLFDINVISTRKEIEFIEQLEETLKPFNIKGIKQYYVLSYRIDYYIPSLKVAIEYDENNHKNYSYEQHEGRQKEIEKELNCRFIRVSDNDTNSYNIGLVIKNMFNL